ncbi:hypothetical protein PILCRDRAFT_6576 [Piloderma croceum F 1598]|uniref:Nuclease Le1 n=1 Tax=Piloderma croceum (strain F 1598) TaxID=765440 RepID=A0A0C3C3Y1_PILCF|nr:hypothetical protein PILCRDRAFT_6576 [Piloderma croceum F 1598]
MKTAHLAGITLALVGRVSAWGQVGHETIGYIAMEFLATNAAAFVKTTIPAKYNNSLGPAAPWADTVRSLSEFKWSAPFHFIDANDDPLGGSCSVEESRDCGNTGCLSTAIANYTQRVNDPSLGATQVMEALYFIDHFLGDIGQPLHVEAYEVGGNDIPAKCNGVSTNLHATWDTGMIVKMVNATYNGDPQGWAAALVEEIKAGSYKSSAAGWISCSSTTEPLSRRRTVEDDVKEVLKARQSPSQITPLACPMVWARESNAYDCSNVFHYTNGTDLCTGTYFNTNIPVINEQIAKQGYRLAAWLNVIFDGSTGL